MQSVCANKFVSEADGGPEGHDTSPTLSDNDARHLAVYFSHRKAQSWLAAFRGLTPNTFGLTGVDKSSFAAMLAQLERQSGGSKPCPDCKGHGFLASKRHKRKLAHQATDKQEQMLRIIGLWEQKMSMPAFDQLCMRCRGGGVVERKTRHRPRGPVTARPTITAPGYIEPASSPAESDALIILSRMHRKIAALFRRSPQAVRIFDAYFDVDNARQKLKSRDMLSLWQLTPAGKTLMRGMELGLSPVEYFQNLRHAQREKPNRNIALQFKACDEQARQLFDYAVAAWVQMQADAA